MPPVVLKFFRQGRFLAGAACLLMLPAVASVSCARVGDPVPPQIPIPKRATELSVVQIGSNARLRIPRPKENVDGSEVRQMQEIRIYRLMQNKETAGASSGPDSGQFRSLAAPLAVLPKGKTAWPESEKYLLFDDPVPVDPISGFWPSIRLCYAVEYLNRHNQSDGLSNLVFLEPQAIPKPPFPVRGSIHADHILLEWDQPTVNIDGSAPACWSGYKLYRSAETPPRFDVPFLPDLWKENFFRDSPVVFDQDVSYAVQVVGCEQSHRAESVLSVPLTLRPTDHFPPATPAHLEAFRLPEGISLRWEICEESDFAGYWLYRSSDPASVGDKLNTQPLKINHYLDGEVRNGIVYYYRISAADRSGNESPPSRSVSCSRDAAPSVQP